MDKRQWISAISLSVAVFALWTVFEMWYLKNHPPAPDTGTAAATQPAPISSAPDLAATNPAATHPSTTQSAVPEMTAGLHAVASTQPAAGISLGSADKGNAKFAMEVDLSPDGAGVGQVILNDFYAPRANGQPKSVKRPYVFQQAFIDHPGTDALGTRSLIIDGKTVDLWNVRWNTVSSTAASATFSVDVVDEQGPVARVAKTYRVAGRNEGKAQTKGFEVDVEQTIRNLRPGGTLNVRAVINGPTPPPAENEQTDDRMIVVGYDEAGKDIALTQHPQLQFKGASATKDLTEDSGRHFVWAGQASTYFGAIVLPGPAEKFNYSARAEGLEPNSETDHDVAIVFDTPEMTIAAGQEVAAPMSVYFGPKWRAVLDDPYYASFPRKYDKLLLYTSKMCAWITSDTLIAGLVLILRGFYFIFRDWGLSIICLVLCVRALLHPITKRSQVQMMKMGKLAPEVEKLKKKYADKPDELNREMMKVYKQQGGAILGCLPMFLQTPIWIALWSALQSTFELRQAPFLYNLTWIKDLAKPDRLVDLVAIFGHPIPIPLIITTWHISAINILPILMAAVTYINQKYFMPMPIAATPEQEQQQKMQRGMSL
ncbi:MAG TPA: YidC/Oxa1 family insertase periplasmic-domain containing protein, partial [Tepidisphaeraceae bacterium]|nr:YidC/Oxa1 family insertase periplasmic-domain containing protein [Tepidisphaeraceae bacterium]